METLFKTITAQVAVITGFAVVLVVVAASWLIRRYRSGGQLDRLVHSISVDALANVVIPDGLNGEIQIDHLLLTPGGLLLLETKDVSGAVFAGENLDLWSTTGPPNRFTFDNPLPQLRNRMDAVAALVSGVSIESRVVFTGKVTFPKGHPDNVATLDGLRVEFNPVPSDRSELNLDGVITQWNVIKAAAVEI